MLAILRNSEADLCRNCFNLVIIYTARMHKALEKSPSLSQLAPCNVTIKPYTYMPIIYLGIRPVTDPYIIYAFVSISIWNKFSIYIIHVWLA